MGPWFMLWLRIKSLPEPVMTQLTNALCLQCHYSLDHNELKKKKK